MNISIFDKALVVIILLLVSVYGIISGSDYGVLFGSFAGSMFYITTENNINKFKKVSYFMISYIAGVICSDPVGAWLGTWLHYTERTMDPLSAVIVSTIAIKLLTVINNYNLVEFLNKIRKGSNNANK